jgi:tripartite-type tricarboxylate transporter receptor subunit TctC
MHFGKKKITRRKLISAAGTMPVGLALSGTGLASLPARAEDQYPSRPIRLIVPFPAGALADSTARPIADGLSRALGQPVVVENKLGANGVIGVSEVARSAPNGYTLLLTPSSSMTVNPQLYKKVPYKAADFTPITSVIDSQFIIVVNPEWAQKNKVETFKDFIALARAKPDTLRYGSPGLGNIVHLSTVLMNNRYNIRTQHIPYKGGNEAQMALMGGVIEFVFDTWAGLPFIQSGRMKALAVTSATRMQQLPDVPTVIESGMPDFLTSFWLGMFAPAGTPAPIVKKLYELIKGVVEEPKTRGLISAAGSIALQDPAAFQRRIVRESDEWGQIIRKENIAID